MRVVLIGSVATISASRPATDSRRRRELEHKHGTQMQMCVRNYARPCGLAERTQLRCDSPGQSTAMECGAHEKGTPSDPARRDANQLACLHITYRWYNIRVYRLAPVSVSVCTRIYDTLCVCSQTHAEREYAYTLICGWMHPGAACDGRNGDDARARAGKRTVTLAFCRVAMPTHH